MEQRQQAAFLTAVRDQNRFQTCHQSNLQVKQLKQKIKSVLSQLPQRNTLINVIENLGLNSNFIQTASNIDKNKNISISEMKKVFQKIKLIQKQISKIRSTYKKATVNLKNSKSQNHSKQKENTTPMQKQVLKSQKISEKCYQNDQIWLKNEIQRELQYRKYVQNIKNETYIERKRRLLAERAKKANQRNKKCEIVLRKVTQKQRDRQLTNFNKFKAMPHEDYSIWANKSKRYSRTSQNQRTIINSNQSQQIDDIEEINQNDKVVTDRSDRIQSQKKTTFYKRNLSHLQRKKGCNQFSLSNFSIREVRCRNALQKRKAYNQQKQKQAIQTVMRKNLTIQSIHKKKSQVSEQDEPVQSSIKQQKDKKSHKNPQNSKIFHSQHNSRTLKTQTYINQLLDQKTKNKQQILKQRSQNIRTMLIKNRKRFIQKRNAIQKQNEVKYDQHNQNYIQIRNTKKQMDIRNQIKIQEVIKQKRQMFQHKQKMAENMFMLKYMPNQVLQKKLAKCEEDIQRRLKFKQKKQLFF